MQLEIDVAVDHFREAVTAVCEAVIPRFWHRPEFREVYWWSSMIAELQHGVFTAAAGSDSTTRPTSRSGRGVVVGAPAVRVLGYFSLVTLRSSALSSRRTGGSGMRSPHRWIEQAGVLVAYRPRNPVSWCRDHV